MCGVVLGNYRLPPAVLVEEERPLRGGQYSVCTVTQIPASVENCFEQKLLCLVVVVDSVAPASVGDPEKYPIISVQIAGRRSDRKKSRVSEHQQDQHTHTG